MITGAVLQFFAWVMDVIFGGFPVVDASNMPYWYTDFSTFVLPSVGALFTVPLFGAVISCFVLGLSMYGGWYLFYWSNWLYNKIRGSG